MKLSNSGTILLLDTFFPLFIFLAAVEPCSSFLGKCLYDTISSLYKAKIEFRRYEGTIRPFEAKASHLPLMADTMP